MGLYNNIKTNIVKTYDKLDGNRDGVVEIYELYPVFLIFSVALFFVIMLKNLNILIIFKEAKYFIVLFTFLTLYSLLKLIDYYNTFNIKNKPTIDDRFYHILNLFVLFLSGFCLVYLSALFFLK
jgi:hypothetical protein